MEKITKQELKKPDVFIESASKFTRWLEANAKLVTTSAVILAVGALGYVVYATMSEKTEAKAQALLFKAQTLLQETEKSFKAPEVPPSLDPAKAPPAPKKASGVLMTDYKDSVEQLRNVVKEFPDTHAANIAALELGRLYYDHKMYDEQIGILEAATAKSKSPLLKGLALSLLGVGYDAKGDCTLAIANWMRIESSPDLKFLGGDSALKTGACYEKLGKTDKAKETYERILKDYKDDTTATQAARKFLRTLGQKG